VRLTMGVEQRAVEIDGEEGWLRVTRHALPRLVDYAPAG
jgi:hypothetical protein